MARQNKKMKKSTLALICLTAFCLVIIGCSMYVALFTDSSVADIIKNIFSGADGQEDGRDENYMLYVNETNYRGETPDYPELYHYPFKKTGFKDNRGYQNNKDFTKEHKDSIAPIEKRVKEYFNLILNTTYRDIAADPDSYKTAVMKYMEPNMTHWFYVESGRVAEEGLTIYEEDGSGDYKQDFTEMTTEQYIEYLSDFLVRNEISAEGEFITDGSLIYRDDGYVWVRGVLKYTLYSRKDDSDPYFIGQEVVVPIGEEQHKVIDVCLALGTQYYDEALYTDYDKYVVHSIYDTASDEWAYYNT